METNRQRSLVRFTGANAYLKNIWLTCCSYDYADELGSRRDAPTGDEGQEEEQPTDNEPPADVDNRRNGRNKRTRPEDGPTEPSRPPKKKRKKAPQRGNVPSGAAAPPDDDDDGGDEISVASPRRSAAPANADEKFLHDAIRQLESQHPTGATLRRQQIRAIMPLLNTVEQPAGDRIQRFANIHAEEDGDQPDCYILSAADAKQVLESDAVIEAPVFVPNGAREGLFTSSTRRPIEQVLRTWFLDGHEIVNSRKSDKRPPGERLVAIAKLRQHFLRDNVEREYPWNMPDILNPRAEECKPLFVQSLNCNFLKDIVRRVLDPTKDEICQENCNGAYNNRLGCRIHELTRTEFHALQESRELWQGTMMLADPGAITLAHCDNWGLSTWISCHEGELGLIWRSHPSEQERNDHLYERHQSRGRSLYKVLRPGEAVYMPCGTIHTVFRRPRGNPTLAFAGHILRRTAIARWLELFLDEADHADSLKNRLRSGDYEYMVPPIARVVQAILDIENHTERFGGQDGFYAAREIVQGLVDRGNSLRQKAFQHPPGVGGVARSPTTSPEPRDL